MEVHVEAGTTGGHRADTDVEHPRCVIAAVDTEAGEEIARGARMGDFSHRFAGWPAAFDHVLMFDFGTPENPLPGLLTPLRSGSFFTIYEITAP